MTKRFWLLAAWLAALVVLAGLSTQAGTAAQVEPSPTIPPTAIPTDTPPPPSPTATVTPTSTPGPYEHVIQSGDFCLGIAYQYGHVDPGIKAVIEELNGMRDCALLPAPGSTILIPRPTASATPVGMDLTQTVVATNAPPLATLVTGPSYAVQSYTVQENDTLSSIAILNDSSLRQICELNPLPDGLDCGGCQWESANCCCPNPPVFSVGQVINVPGPTPTPSPSPTFTGSETPTTTPTYRAPVPVYPPDGANIAGGVRFTWVTVGPLAAQDVYLVFVQDQTTGATYTGQTDQLSLDLPLDYLPQDGQPHTFTWQVTVHHLGEDGQLYRTGAVVPERSFTWQGWE